MTFVPEILLREEVLLLLPVKWNQKLWQTRCRMWDCHITQFAVIQCEGDPVRATRINFVKDHLDVLVAPTMGPAWTTDLINGDRYTGGSAAQSAAMAGYPHITVPMGFVAELPVGLSFFGRAWSEPTLIRLAYAYEQATRHRRPPRLAASATRPQEYINR